MAGLEPIHWILIGIGFIILISVIGAVGRSNERRKLEQRAERLRNSPGALKASVRGKGKGDKSKLRI